LFTGFGYVEYHAVGADVNVYFASQVLGVWLIVTYLWS